MGKKEPEITFCSFCGKLGDVFAEREFKAKNVSPEEMQKFLPKG